MTVPTRVSVNVNPEIGRKVTTHDIVTYLRERYKFDKYKKQFVGFDELRMGSGFKQSALQGIDYWVMDTWGGQLRTSFEIKTSRSDFLVEIKKPTKRRCALLVSNYFYFIAPKGMLKIEEIPAECGLIEVWWTNNDWEIERVIEGNDIVLTNEAVSLANWWEGKYETYMNTEPRRSKVDEIPELRELLVAQTVIDAPLLTTQLEFRILVGTSHVCRCAGIAYD